MPDTTRVIQMIHDTIYVKGAESLDILNKVDTLYNNAWNRLIWVVAIFGVVLPIAISAFHIWLQKNTIKMAEEKMQKKIDDNVGMLDEVKLGLWESKSEL